MAKTMRGKRLLKRLFYGKLVRLPSELPAEVASQPHLSALGSHSAGFSVLYAIGKLERLSR